MRIASEVLAVNAVRFSTCTSARIMPAGTAISGMSAGSAPSRNRAELQAAPCGRSIVEALDHLLRKGDLDVAGIAAAGDFIPPLAHRADRLHVVSSTI